ncbi:MAG: AmmeMemoRadiSam system radical SAM enzyme [Deltaproteobacteria bacterium]|nr:AmmeMemoRadiSam system radical SAM enzyme [Deltaproteobacteria bacterium]
MTDRTHPARYWHKEGARYRCEVCPRACLVSPGQKAFCVVREGGEQGMVLTTYGRSSGFCIDPIEKKPLFHFYPGTPILSFGTAGCNLGCQFCQNWDISKARHDDALQSEASPAAIARTAVNVGARSVAFTYNDPTIFLEYALDTAAECKTLGVHTVAVTNGYIQGEARVDLYNAMDAANIDLKAFTDQFYREVCLGHLEPVKETLKHVVKNTSCWVELTTLLIPGHNDSDTEIEALATWVAKELGPEVPLHFSAFHPDYKLMDAPPTPPATLSRARDLARKAGLRYVYTGNVHDADGESTWCPSCGERLIERDWYTLGGWNLREGCCGRCGTRIAGRFEPDPGHWGARRQPLRIMA